MAQKSKTFKDIKQLMKKRKPSDFIDDNQITVKEAINNIKKESK